MVTLEEILKKTSEITSVAEKMGLINIRICNVDMRDEEDSTQDELILIVSPSKNKQYSDFSSSDMLGLYLTKLLGCLVDIYEDRDITGLFEESIREGSAPINNKEKIKEIFDNDPNFLEITFDKPSQKDWKGYQEDARNSGNFFFPKVDWSIFNDEYSKSIKERKQPKCR